MNPENQHPEYVSLRELLEQRLTGLRSQMEAHWEAHTREHDASVKAIDRASEGIDRRLDEMNELRHQIERERTLYVTRTELEAITKAINALERVQANAISRPEHDVLIAQIRQLENWRSGQEGRMAVLYGAIALVPVVVTIVFRFVPVGSGP